MDITPKWEFIPSKDKVFSEDTETSLAQSSGGGITSAGGYSWGEGNSTFKIDPARGIWLGAAEFASAPFSVSMAGALVASDLTITGGTIKYGKTTFADTANPGYFISASGLHFGQDANNYFKYTIGGTIELKGAAVSSATLTSLAAGSEIAIQGWTSTLTFVVADYRTVTWSAGGTDTIKLLDGTTYTIAAGSTGNMAALTYIYLDIAVSTTALQVTTTAATAVGTGKILVAVAQNNTDTTSKASLQVFGGKGGQNIFVDNIAANSASTNEFVSNTAQIANLVVTDAKINSLGVAKLTAGSITSKAISLAVSEGSGDSYIGFGKTDFTNTENGGIFGVDDSDGNKAKFYLGSSTKYINFVPEDGIANFHGIDVTANQFLIEATAGENLTAEDCVYYSPGGTVYHIEQLYAETYATIEYDAHVQVAQSFMMPFSVPTGTQLKITFSVKKSAGNTHQLGIDIEGSNLGLPNNSPIENTVYVNAADIGTSFAEYTVTFTTIGSYTAGNRYWIVFYMPAGHAGDQYMFQDTANELSFIGGYEASSSDGGSTWAGATRDLYIRIGRTETADAVYKLTCHSQHSEILGFVSATVTAGNTAKVQNGATIVVAGKTANTYYYLDANGALSTSPTNYCYNRKLLYTLSATKALNLVDNIDQKYVYGNDLVMSATDTWLHDETDYTRSHIIGINQPGNYRVDFGLYSSDGAGTAYGRIYVNDVATGTERSTSEITEQTYSQLISNLKSGDIVSIYSKISNNAYDVYIKNFKIYGKMVRGQESSLGWNVSTNI